MSTELIIGILSLLINVSLLWLGIKAYKKFLSKLHTEKQLETVYNLINEIQNNFNIYYFNTGNADNKSNWCTLFDVSEMTQFDDYDRLYFFCRDNNSEDIFNWDFFTKYYSNPLLPKQIALKLKPFNNFHWSSTKYEEIRNEKCIIIGSKRLIQNDISCLYIKDSQIEKCKGFKASIIELRESINDWLSSYGIKDLNITTSHQHK